MQHTCHIGLIGWGTVGSGVIDILAHQDEQIANRCGILPKVKAVVTRSPERERTQDIGDTALGSDVSLILDDPDISIVLLLVGGTTVAKDMCLACLRAGKHVVTANKAIIAEHWDELFRCARQQNVCLVYEAAVAGGIPIIDVLRDSYIANRIDAVHGILNGTCN